MKKNEKHITVETENLAVPEVHTEEGFPENDEPEEQGSILYDNLAVPEIKIKNENKNDLSR